MRDGGKSCLEDSTEMDTLLKKKIYIYIYICCCCCSPEMTWVKVSHQQKPLLEATKQA